MSKVIKIISLVALLLTGNLFASLAQERSSHGVGYEKGKAEAAENIKKGIYIIKAWGLPEIKLKNFPWPTRDEFYQSILKKKYKITYNWIGGCEVVEETLNYGDGYNEVSVAGIEAKYGKGILDKVRQQADSEYEMKYGNKERERQQKFVEGIKSLPKSNNE